MEQLNNDSNISSKNEGKDLEIMKVAKKRKLNNLNNEPSSIDSRKSIINAIDNKNIDEIEKLSKKINKNKKIDIIFEIYDNKLLTSERLHFIMNYCNKYFNISSNLMKKLIKDKNVDLLDIIFNHLKIL